MRSPLLAPRRRGYITQLVETLARPPGTASEVDEEAELELELENQLGMEIDQALAAPPVDAPKPDIVVDVAGR